MGKYLGLHEKSYIGATTQISSGATTANGVLLATPSLLGPARYLVMGSEHFYLRQGNSTVVAAATDMRLQRWQPIVIVVDSEQNNYLAVLRVSVSGTVKVTRLDDETP